jgi:hypothetical protein
LEWTSTKGWLQSTQHISTLDNLLKAVLSPGRVVQTDCSNPGPSRCSSSRGKLAFLAEYHNQQHKVDTRNLEVRSGPWDENHQMWDLAENSPPFGLLDEGNPDQTAGL